MPIHVRALFGIACLSLALSCSDSDSEDPAGDEAGPTDAEETDDAPSDDDADDGSSDDDADDGSSDDDADDGSSDDDADDATGPGLCLAVDVAAVVALMEEPLEITDDTNVRCKLSGEGPNSFVVERNLTGGESRYDQQLELLGSDELLDGIGDRAFRSGYVYGIHVGDQYVTVVFAIARPLDATERLSIVEHVVASLP